ncbi:MAG TPA: sugar transferase [Acidimicrobiales bacterium]|nr:sugar transferase [Acidimicrobiales bacterium]
MAAGYVVVTLIVLYITGAYRPRISYRLSPQVPVLLAQLTVAAVVVACWPSPHRLTVIDHLPLIVAAVFTGRLLAYWLLRSRPRRGNDALILGADARGQLVAHALLHHHGCGIVPVGFVDDQPSRSDETLPVLCDLSQLDHMVDRLGIKHLIVAQPGEPDGIVSSCLWRCQARDIDVWTVPALFERGSDPCALTTDQFWAVPFQHLRRPGQHTRARMVKRAFDVSVALAVLLATAPLLAAVALAVRLTSPGPVFFRQRRIGQHGRVFELLKFRTMFVNDDSDTAWSIRDGDRMTSIGRLLRATSIDELPQMINVLRGDMSLVGPRPERPFFHDQFCQSVPRYAERLRGPVGITGWAQVHGLRGDTSIEERTRFDNYYIEHWSLWLDVVIMVRTVAVLVQATLDARAADRGGAPVPAPDIESLIDARPGAPAAVALPVNASVNQR